MIRKFPLLGAMLSALTLSMVPDAAQAANPQVLMKTSAGEIVIELYPDKAPKTVANFLQYVKDGHYSGTLFHRVIGNFMIQGGGYERSLYDGKFDNKTTRAPIELESKNGLKNDIGWVAMARTGNPNSATSQFFINVADNASLNHPSPDGHGYAVFGKVVKGMDVVAAIRDVKTKRVGPFSDVPADPVTIDSMTVVGAK